MEEVLLSVLFQVTNFELATHTALIISWPGMGRPSKSSSYVEFVDIFPTLSDLGGISVPPLCPADSSDVELCTEGISLRPIFFDSTHEVKLASFSQYPHGPHGALETSAGEFRGDKLAPLPCPNTVAGSWLAVQKGHTRNNVFVFNVSSNGGVIMDFSDCGDCSFESAVGSLTATGVNLTLKFHESTRTDFQIGTFANNSCQLLWTTNSTDASGHWTPFFREGHIPPNPAPTAPAGTTYMGYTMITKVEGIEYRYTEWPLWRGNPATKGVADWTNIAGVELYNHTADPEENENIESQVPPALVNELRAQLRAGWRAALLPNGTTIP